MFDLDKSLRQELYEQSKNDEFFVYEPREDSDLLLRNLDKEIKKSNITKLKILEIGVGSGYIAFNTILNHNVDYYGVDINEDAVNFTSIFYKNHKKMLKGKFKVTNSNLFSKIKKSNQFDIIIFNPPYLPYESGEPQKIAYALSGGRNGYELAELFIKNAKEYLNNAGTLLFIVSSLKNNHKKMNQILEQELYDFEAIDTDSFYFEKIFLYRATKSKLLQQFKSIKLFAQGKHSYVYKYKHYAIKKLKLNDFRYEKEKQLLNRLNKYNIGPKYITSIEGYNLTGNILAYEFVEGIFVKDYLHDLTLTKLKRFNKLLFNQVVNLDFIGIKKEEFTKITTNAIVSPKHNKITLIDFERSHYCQINHNFTQYFEFLKRNLRGLNLIFELPKKSLDELKRYKYMPRDQKKLKESAQSMINTLFLYADVLNYFKENQNKVNKLNYKELAEKFKISERQVRQITNQSNKD